MKTGGRCISVHGGKKEHFDEILVVLSCPTNEREAHFSSFRSDTSTIDLIKAFVLKKVLLLFTCFFFSSGGDWHVPQATKSQRLKMF